MGTISTDCRRAGVRAVLFMITVFAIAFLWAPPPGHAADLKFVEGIVKGVSGAEIDVGGKTYRISGVPLRTVLRKAVSPAELPGKKVTLHFRGRALVYVLVHPDVME